ncbi:MAG: hypothetical protein OMM_01501 [Candidatus Magnetoglobus multicellularis str. Araruama]|uniref:Uncharacterized protein n=1 Tax=Candidatus Magnetoglobus multicellularis str. Araruama TaxID=890399 RepID=A0A1V1PD89_9BACT|nr:MAG: hypothetical protein OMM_01501 [Candidatus Magnetoglobus multicellularis str. Araruama]
MDFLSAENYLSEQQFLYEIHDKVFENNSQVLNADVDYFSNQIRDKIQKSEQESKKDRQTTINLIKFINRIYNLIINGEPTEDKKQKIVEKFVIKKQKIVEKFVIDILQYEAYLPDFIKSIEVLLLEIQVYLLEIISDVNPDLPFKCECIDPIIDSQRGIKKAIDIIGSKNNRQNLFDILGVSRTDIIGINEELFYNSFILPYVDFVINGICRLYLYKNIKFIDISGVDFFNEHRINVEQLDELFLVIKLRFKSLFDIEFILPQLCHDVFDETLHSDQYTKSSLSKSGFINIIDRIEISVIYDLISPGIRSHSLNINKKPEVIYKVS